MSVELGDFSGFFFSVGCDYSVVVGIGVVWDLELHVVVVLIVC
jgi:hypothetical protein